jgi:hypothetical protein
MPRKSPKPDGIPDPVCPYTGQAMLPVFDDDTRSPGWYLTGGLDMAVPFFTKEDLYLANTARLGKKNIAQSLKCAYTGAALKAVENRGLWYAVPVDLQNTELFSVSARRPGKDRLLWLAAHRNGKAPGFPEPKPVIVREPEAEHEHFVDTTEGLAHNADDAEVKEFVDKLTR